ncbi:MAG: HAMP domain-containing sensor histidine kinase [Nitrososphaeraceae archaeon]
MRDEPNILKAIRSKIGLKIGLLVVIQIAFVTCSFSVLSYYESQGTHLGNSINIAGKNRFLTSNLLLQVSEYFSEGGNSSDPSKINSAMDQLESNMLALKQGGMISDIDLRPLPSMFLENWDKIYQEWVSLKGILTNSVIQPNENINLAAVTTLPSVPLLKTTIETSGSSLLNSSNALATELGEYARVSSQNLMILQGIFAILNIAVAAIVLYLVLRILRPIFDLTSATSEIGRGNLEVSVKSRGNDELSVLTKSFNSMVNSLKSYIKKQNELTKQLEDANEQLKYRDKLKDEFINVAAHELRTPIQPILGLTEYLHFSKVGPNDGSSSIPITVKQEEIVLDIILRNSKRLMQLTEDILDVTKIENGSFRLKKEKFDFNKMIMEILYEYRQRIDSNGDNVSLYYEGIEGVPIIIEGDRSRLCQVVNNLLSNAFKFTTKGSIRVIVDRHDKDNNKIIVKIKDTGIGIHRDIMPKLFTKFATKSDTGGTGLELFISKCIIEKHGGSIWAGNNNFMGATFTFSLPIYKDEK